MRSASALEVTGEEISCLAVSEHLSIVATGSIYGTIMVWDFELFKVESVFIGSKMAITAISFVKDYPLMISASQSGIISVYAVRGSPKVLKHHCLGRFLNVNYDFDRFKNIPITGLAIELVPNPRYNPKEKKMNELA